MYYQIISTAGLPNSTGRFPILHPVKKRFYLELSNRQRGAMSGAKIFDSTLKAVSPIENCELQNTMAIQLLGSRSFFRDCGVHKAKLQNCEVTGGFLTESVARWSVSLHKFPVEIRRMIYSSAIAIDGLATRFVAALRPDAVLYGEILEFTTKSIPFPSPKRI